MNIQIPEREDKRNLLQRVIGALLLEKCPKCNKYAFSAANYGNEGHCSVCGHTTPSLKLKNKDNN